MEHLVRERQHVQGGVEVAHRPVQVDRLDRVAADEVDHLEGLAQLEEVAEGVPRAGPPRPVQSDDVGRAAHRPEGDGVTADGQRVGRVPRVQGERRRARADRLDDHVRVEPDTVAVDAGAGGGEPLA